MKKSKIMLVLVVLVLVTSLPISADEITVRFESRVIESWDGQDATFFSDTGEPISWYVRGSKFSAPDLPEIAYAMNEWPDDLFGTRPDNPESLGALGIHGAFERQGYNRIELIPGVNTADGFVAKAIPLPGRIQTLDFWVWGSNYEYFTEVHFRDYQGVSHVLFPFRNENLRDPGSIKFIGWKNMYITMPSHIKQAVSYKPELATLHLSKFVFTTHPDEIVSDFYIYLDHLKVLTDIHESFYDGSDLTNRERIAEIWGAGE